MLLVCVLAAAAMAGDRSSRYDVILARQPFGRFVEEKKEFKPPPPPPPPPPITFTRYLRMTAVTEWRGARWVGFVRTRAKRRKYYFLRVGQTEDGITVLAADFAGERACLRKNGRTGWISMRR